MDHRLRDTRAVDAEGSGRATARSRWSRFRTDGVEARVGRRGARFGPTTGGSKSPSRRFGVRRGWPSCVFGSSSWSGPGCNCGPSRCAASCDESIHQFDFCSLDLGPNELEGDVASLGGSTDVVSIRTPRFPLEFSRFLRRGRYDVVHTEPQFLSGIVVWLAALQRVPIMIVAVHNSIGDAGRRTASNPVVRIVLPSRPFIWAMRWLITRYATDVIAVSKSALDSALPDRWQSIRDCKVVYNGTDVAPFRVPVIEGAFERSSGWPADSRIVVNVGRLSAQKNHRVILETLRLVHRQDGTVRSLLIGGGQLYQEVDRLIDQLGLREICAITNNRADVPRLLLASDVFFFPSSWEGLPGRLWKRSRPVFRSLRATSLHPGYRHVLPRLGPGCSPG